MRLGVFVLESIDRLHAWVISIVSHNTIMEYYGRRKAEAEAELAETSKKLKEFERKLAERKNKVGRS